MNFHSVEAQTETITEHCINVLKCCLQKKTTYCIMLESEKVIAVILGKHHVHFLIEKFEFKIEPGNTQSE